ncbi:MAG: PqqD family protein [bacterium]|nr:PqqD family protein [bacterium]
MSANLLELIPIRSIKSIDEADGTVTILKPKFKNPWVVKFVATRVKNPDYKVKLDAYGSFVWKQIDGERTIEEIGNNLREQFLEDVEPVYERLGDFIHSLIRFKFIEFENYTLETAQKH